MDVPEVRRERNLLIPVDDGVEIAADLHLPGEPGRYPVLISFYPYRKDDFIGADLEYARTYFAQRGYAVLLVDFRGIGSSGGECPVTFESHREAEDGARVVEWAAAQEWCNGDTAVWGVSYGGIMSLAVAAQRPPHLKAIAPIYACADIHRDFLAPGGTRNCLGAHTWFSMMLALDLAPPGLQDPDGRWMQIWRDRLERVGRGELWGVDWPQHPEHDDYWQSREISIERIQVPTFLIGGWRDIFPQAMLEAYERLEAPKKVLMGPWLHLPPDISPHVPIDWLGELARFFDAALKGEGADPEDDPPVTLYVQGAECWRAEPEWPIARTELRTWHLGAGGTLSLEAGGDHSDTYVGDPTVGASSALWDPLGIGLGYPQEQAEDDLRSLTYTSEPLDEGIEITGAPEAVVHVALDDGGELQLVTKLNAVAPDGTSTMVTTGWMAGDATAGSGPAEYRIPLWSTSYFVPAGHRLRLAIACSDFPRIWPLPSVPAIRVHTARSHISIPGVPAANTSLPDPELPTPVLTPERAGWFVPGDAPTWKVEREVGSGEVTVELNLASEIRPPGGGSFSFALTSRASASAQRPDAAAARSEARIDMHMAGGEQVEVRASTRFTRDTMHMNGEVTLDGRQVLSGEWTESRDDAD